MRNLKTFLALVGILAVAGLLTAAYDYSRSTNIECEIIRVPSAETGSATFTVTANGNIASSGTNTWSGANVFSSTAAFGNNVTYTAPLIISTAGEFQATAASVSLTSPTTSFSAAGKYLVTLTSDANQTGITVTGGDTGQLLTIVSGAGSNTMRFDDNATTLALGGNITLTEGQSDVLTLLCTDGTSGHNTWAAVSTHDN